MPRENRSTEGAPSFSSAIANDHSSSGLSQPAVTPIPKIAAHNAGPASPSMDDVPGQERSLPHEAWPVVQQKRSRVQATMQMKPGVATQTKVVQRALITKKEIFEDQVKWTIVQGIANYVDSKSGSERAKSLAELFDNKGLISLAVLVAAYQRHKVQKRFWGEQKAAGLKDITLEKLQEQGLVMEAVTTIDVSDAKWDIYKADIKSTDTATGASGELQGRAGDTAQTTIKWESPENEQGKGVTAKVLALDHPLGTTPDKTIKTKVDTLAGAAKKDYIAGHLLNNNLGGPGNDAKNLTAIPMDVNSELSKQVEDKVIEWVNKKQEVVYYKVEVDYGDDGALKYASKITVNFGRYKPATNFAAADPATDLEDSYKYVIPINAPSVYKNSKGYTKSEKASKFVYTDSAAVDYELPNVNPVNAAAKLAFDPETNIVLKNTAQIKLEFISFAIYALRINSLQEEVATLRADTKGLKNDFELLRGKYNSLGEEAKKAEKLREQIQQLQVEFEEEKEQSALAKKDFEETAAALTAKLERQTETAATLREELVSYMQKSRERAEHLGYVIGQDDGENNNKNNVSGHKASRRISLGSEEPFEKGYNDGYEKGKRLFLERKENAERIDTLTRENAALQARLEQLEALLARQTTTVSGASSLILSDAVSSGEQEKKNVEIKKKFMESLRTAYGHGKTDGHGMFGRSVNIGVWKYEYLAMLVAGEIITGEAAYAAYPNAKYYDKFTDMEEMREVLETKQAKFIELKS